MPKHLNGIRRGKKPKKTLMPNLPDDQQTTNHLAMVRADVNVAIDYGNLYTLNLSDNTFVCPLKLDVNTLTSRVNHELDHLIKVLTDNGIVVDVHKPAKGANVLDSLFANNWISFHWETTIPAIVLYPLKSEPRRLERLSTLLINPLIDQQLKSTLAVVSLVELERGHYYLEGSGSLVVDRQNLIAYCAESERASLDKSVLQIWSEKLNYLYCEFKTADHNHIPIYHTDLVLHLGLQYAIVCAEAIVMPDERKYVLDTLKEQSHRDVIVITMAQMSAYCANCLQVRNQSGQLMLIMSKTAYDAFTPTQRQKLESYNSGGLIKVDFSTIEHLTGGSVKSCLVEMSPVYDYLK